MNLHCTALLTACLLGCSHHSPNPLESKESLVARLQSRFDLLGPFVAELEFEGSPPVVYDGQQYSSYIVAADLKSRRLHFGMEDDVGSVNPKRWLAHFFGMDMYSVEDNNKVTKRAQNVIVDILPQTIENLSRTIDNLSRSPQESGHRGHVHRAMHPYMNLLVQPSTDRGRAQLTAALGISDTGRCAWLTRILDEPSVTWKATEKEVLWESPSGWKILLDQSTGFIKSYEIQSKDARPVRLVLRRFEQRDLPSDASIPNRFDTRQLSPIESVQLFHGFSGSPYQTIKDQILASNYREDILEATLTALAAAEAQLMYLQLRREVFASGLQNALNSGMSLSDLKAKPDESREVLATIVKTRNAEIRGVIRDYLDGLHQTFISSFRSDVLGRDRLLRLEAIFRKAYQREKVEAVGLIVPNATDQALFDEALRSVSHR